MLPWPGFITSSRSTEATLQKKRSLTRTTQAVVQIAPSCPSIEIHTDRITLWQPSPLGAILFCPTAPLSPCPLLHLPFLFCFKPSHHHPIFFCDPPPPFFFLLSPIQTFSSPPASLSPLDLLVSSSCDITGHCSLLGLDIRPRCQATAVKGLSVIVCVACARMCVFMSVYSYVSERCVSDFPRLALYLCMKNDQNRSTSMLYLRSKHVDDWAASLLSSTTEEEGCVCVALMKKKDGTNECARQCLHLRPTK